MCHNKCMTKNEEILVQPNDFVHVQQNIQLQNSGDTPMLTNNKIIIVVKQWDMFILNDMIQKFDKIEMSKLCC